jgi:hypothetical protein
LALAASISANPADAGSPGTQNPANPWVGIDPGFAGLQV